jgi:hypothetical protein
MARERGCHNPVSLWECLLGTELVWGVAMGFAAGFVAAFPGLMATSSPTPTAGGAPSQPSLTPTTEAGYLLPDGLCTEIHWVSVGCGLAFVGRMWYFISFALLVMGFPGAAECCNCVAA